MADPKSSPSAGTTVNTDPTLGDSRAAVLDSFVLLAILSSAFAQVRLFETVEGSRVPRLERPLPSPHDLLFVLRSFLRATPSPSPDVPDLPEERDSKPRPGIDWQASPPDAVLAFYERLRQSVDENAGRDTAKAILRVVRALRDSAAHSPTDSAPLPSAFDRPVATPQAALDLIYDELSGSCHAELAPWPQPDSADSAQLRGEDLSELRRNADLFSPPEPSARPDLPSDAYLTAASAAARLGVAKSTVTRRIARDRLVGFPLFTRALRIPKDQFVGDDVIPGVQDVLVLFARGLHGPVDHKAAWTFLNSDLFHGDPDPRPIDRLRTAAATGTTPALLSELARAKDSLDRGDHF